VTRTIGRVPGMIGWVPQTVCRLLVTFGRSTGEIVVEYHPCITSYRAQLGTWDMFYRWIEHLVGVESEVVECSILCVIIIKIACEFSRVALSQ
jgi:hypothetical protein